MNPILVVYDSIAFSYPVWVLFLLLSSLSQILLLLLFCLLISDHPDQYLKTIPIPNGFLYMIKCSIALCNNVQVFMELHHKNSII